jgi:hypothetical protein
MSATERKIIQIALDSRVDGEPTVYALADDGTIWSNNLNAFKKHWEYIPNLKDHDIA